MSKPIRVLVVDDSASVRAAMTAVLRTDEGISVIGAAPDPFIAVEMIAREVPDVITLDVEMPKMDGLAFLSEIMRQHPIPVVICSSLARPGSATALSALERGAVDVIAKPELGTRTFFEESAIRICDAVRAAAQARPRTFAKPVTVEPKLSADAVLARGDGASMIETTDRVIAVGASTGGTEALRVFIGGLPVNCPGVLVVQHMPEKFTASFAQRLDQLSRVSVQEAQNGDRLLPGHVLIAPGNRHLLLKRHGAQYHVEIREGPLVSRHRPSVDVLFRSVARYAGRNAIGVIMTGMGDDGARGLKEMKDAGAVTFAQDEASCVVFGMPQEAIRLGAADHVAPLEQLAQRVLSTCAVRR
jgi:two-component system, chemotaxis family, protein-glutamate methylesterase/glutaminase